MRQDRVDIITYLVIIGALVACGWAGYHLYQDGQTAYQIVSGTGAIASVFGLAAALLQIAKIRSNSEAARVASEDAQRTLRDFISVANVSRASEFSREIQRYLRNGNMEATEIRLKDLKRELVHIKGSRFAVTKEVQEELDVIIKDFGTGIMNIQRERMGLSKGYDVTQLMQRLEDLHTVLTELEVSSRREVNHG